MQNGPAGKSVSTHTSVHSLVPYFMLHHSDLLSSIPFVVRLSIARHSQITVIPQTLSAASSPAFFQGSHFAVTLSLSSLDSCPISAPLSHCRSLNWPHVLIRLPVDSPLFPCALPGARAPIRFNLFLSLQYCHGLLPYRPKLRAHSHSFTLLRDAHSRGFCATASLQPHLCLHACPMQILSIHLVLARHISFRLVQLCWHPHTICTRTTRHKR